MRISRWVIALSIVSVWFDQVFACVWDGGPTGAMLQLIVVIVMASILWYLVYKLLWAFILKKTDVPRARKWKIIVIQAVSVILVLFLINSITQWQLSLLC